jgi:hypothetical protein
MSQHYGSRAYAKVEEIAGENYVQKKHAQARYPDFRAKQRHTWDRNISRVHNCRRKVIE